jgi:hypothetical protein
LSEQRAKAQGLENEVMGLRSQLEELVVAKKTEEAELMEKFRDLLNEKKVKIREQQRILATASVDAEKLEASQRSTGRGAKGHKPGPSRVSKRKAAATPVDESEDDDGFEAMDMDKVKKEPSPTDSEDADRTTDAETDLDATGSEDEDADKDKDEDKERIPPTAPPPRRELPFGMKKSKESAPKTPAPQLAAAAAGSETESEDDEL